MYKKYLKRFFDIIISVILLIPLSIVFIFVSLAIFIEDGTPIIYAGERLGKNSKVFKMYKFRSMYVNAADIRNNDGSTYNSKNDPRVTKVGHIIRELSIDELPQIINVLKGDMSIIGPRASVGNSLSDYRADELAKLSVKPGITGYSQAYYRNSLSQHEKRLKDAWYANHLSFFLDVKIFFKTIETVLLRKGLYTNEQ